MTTGVASSCPNCGAPLRFGAGQSLAAVCGYCRSAIARRGLELSLIGQVPDLVATDTRLALHQSGAIAGLAFTLLGHLQLGRAGRDDHVDAAWDEWYVSLADGGWGWLAEAQGRLYFTRPLEPAPGVAFSSLAPGRRLDLPGLGVLAVEEVGSARFVSAEGELPFAPAVGDSYRFADLSSADGHYYTFDYGAADAPDAEAEVFAGQRFDYRQLGLAAGPPPGIDEALAGEALACPNCGASLALKQADSVSVACPSCHALLERDAGGHLELLLALAGRDQPALPLGSHGVIGGEAATVLGWMRRATDFDGTRYYWEEYLLQGESGYRWLTQSDGQWHLVSPVDAGRVSPDAGSATFGGRRYKHFQSALATYDAIQGEFYWRLRVDEPVATSDFVAPPTILSSENDGREESWSFGRWLPAAEVEKAFKLTVAPAAAGSVGAAEPNPFAPRMRGSWATSGIALAGLLAVSLLVRALLPRETLLSVDVPIGAGAPPDSQVYLSEPFEIGGLRQAVEVSAYAALEQAWVGLDTALINDDTGESDAVGIDLAYYHGRADGESWSEGSRRGSEIFGGVRRGRYLLRVEPQFGRDALGALPESVHVEVIRGAFLWAPFVLALIALPLYPLYVALRRFGFEKRRWENSDHPLVQSS